METELTIQQVAQRTGLSIDTLRYYERIGLLEPVIRNRSGHRRYTESDLNWLDLLMHLKNTGMPLAQMVRFAQLGRQGSATLTERRLMLEQYQLALQQHIQEVEQHLLHVQAKIARFKTLEAQQDAAPHAVDPGTQNKRRKTEIEVFDPETQNQ
jgi:DNA-binding transcriptional MerR regulator